MVDGDCECNNQGVPLHCLSSPPDCRGPGVGDDGGRSGNCADAAADMGSPPVSVVGNRASDNNSGGVCDDRDDTCSRVGVGARAVVVEGVCIEATSGTCCSVSGRICGEVDNCVNWVCSGARTTS